MADRNTQRTCWALAATFAVLAGCQSFRLPAIDPSGQRIFLPAPASTSVVAPQLPQCRLPSMPQPAFTAPADPPACADAVAGAPSGTGSCLPDGSPAKGPGLLEHDGGTKLGRIVITPGRLVAPVGSEVVFVAGLCDPDGHYVVKQPLEWILSQESVGHFVDIGEPGGSFVPPMWNSGTKKVSSNFAVSRTTAKTVVYTRGTSKPNDDFVVKRGQSWLSLTSPSEGVSHVTVWAPNAEGWDMRRQTATVHWVDAQWQLPTPAVVRAGERQVLRTRVTRTTGAAAKGWRVRYEITDGPAAGFAPSGARQVEAPVDDNGEAVVEILPQTTTPGVTQIQIQIIRPGEKSGEPSQIVLGQGWTSITWSAAGLDVQVSGPARAGVGDVLTFRVDVANPGDLYARNITLRDVLPPSFERLTAVPEGQLLGDYMQWTLGDLGPRDVRAFTVTCRAQRDGIVRYCFRATGDDNLQAEGCAETDVFTSKLRVEMAGPETAEVGQSVTYRIDITNTGTTPLTNVGLVDRFDAGLRHSEGQSSPIERLVGTLQPGETRSDLAVTFIVVSPGRHCHNLEVSADGGHRAVSERCLVATAPSQTAPPTSPTAPGTPTPRLQVRKSGPARLDIGKTGLYLIEIRNVGDAPAQNIRVIDRYDAGLRPIQATTGAVATEAGQAISWTIREIAPGATELREVECRGLRPGEAVVGEVTVSTESGLKETARTTTAVEGQAPGEDVNLTAPGGTAADTSGELKVDVISLDNPVRVGQPARFIVELRNTRQQSDRNIIVTITLPEGVAVQRVAGPGVTPRLAGNILRFEPVAELRAGETLRPPFEVELTPQAAGKLKISVKVESLRSREPIAIERESDVLAR